MNFIAIMAGGVGSRFWPGSREHLPKQFLDIMGVGQSLLRLTFERASRIVPTDRIFILTHAKYADLVAAHLPEISRAQILCEPSRNNTAPCIAYIGLKLAALQPDACFAVLPSDHIILKEGVFVDKLTTAFDFAARRPALVTLGISPTRPDTGYGYIQFHSSNEDGVHAVERFVEKPNLETAKSYLASGRYLWNAGIFVWSAQALIDGLNRHAPEVIRVLNQDPEFLNTPAEQDYINRVYPQTPNISIDYALLEKADNVYTIPADIGWSDLGTWASLYAEMSADAHGNVVTHATPLLYNTTDCLVRGQNQGKLIVIKDLHDYIVIDTDSVLLIHPKSKEQEIKAVTADVKAAFGDQYI